MGQKEEVSAGYIEAWHARTKDWQPAEKRRAHVVGSDGCGNIGSLIVDCLSSDPTFDAVYQTDKKAYDPIVEHAPHYWDGLDTLVLANGRTNLDWIEDQPWDEIEMVIGDKLVASIHATSQFVERTIEDEHLKYIVFVGSMAHRAVLNGSAPYCAASAGLNHFARCVAWELAPKGYRVFIVNPSNTQGTPMTEETILGLMRYRDLDRAQAEEYWGAVRALPRWLQAVEIGTIVRELVTNRSMEWLAGCPLDLGGGTR